MEGKLDVGRDSMDSFEIARLAGVSRKTVQRVLNNHPNVKPETKEKILALMEQHHYLPNASARKLSSKKTNTIGIFIIQDVKHYTLFSDDLFFGPVIGAMISQSAHRNYKTLITILDITDPEPLFTLYKQRSIDGGVMVSWSNLQSIVDKISLAGFHAGVFLQNNIDQASADILVPILDDRKGAYDAARYLLELGHRDVAIITGDMNNPAAVKRFEGFQDALNDAAVAMPDSNVYYGNYTEESGEAAIDHWITREKLPKAVFCSNDQTAYGALKALFRHGIDVPNEISVVGYDDLLISQYTHPPLTTMKVPRVEMAVSLVDQLIDRLENKDNNEGESESLGPTFRAELMIRNSCKEA